MLIFKDLPDCEKIALQMNHIIIFKDMGKKETTQVTLKELLFEKKGLHKHCTVVSKFVFHKGLDYES